MDHPVTGRIQTEPVSPEASVEVQDLVRRLVREATRSCGAASTLCHVEGAAEDASAEAVLLNIEVDGVRCLLVRSHQISAREQEILSPREQEIARMIAR